MNSPSRFKTSFLFCLLLLFFCCLLTASAGIRDSQYVLEGIARSLDAGLNWGRQCLVGSIRYPLLPALWMWLCMHAGPCRKILLVLPAFGCLYFLCRWHFLHRPDGRFSLPDSLALIMGILFFVYSFFLQIQLPPAAFFFTGVLFYVFCYQENHHRLGNLVMAAFCLGLLSLCGFLTALASGLLLLEILAVRGILNNGQGICLNLCLPFCYGLLLILILNWLIMGDCMFYFHEAYLWTSGSPWACFQEPSAVFALLLLNLPGMIFPVLLLLQKDRKYRQKGRILLFACCLILLENLLSVSLGFRSDRLNLCLLLEFWSAMLLLKAPGKRLCYAVLLLLLLMTLCHYQKRDNLLAGILPTQNAEKSFTQQAELEQYIDHYWQNARVILLGDRLPAIFRDYTEKRYIARLDFQKWEILKQAETEQLHILLPPPEAGYYPQGKHSPLAQIYEKGAPWLLLEKQFHGGWQLLRVVPPPKGESRLEKFL